MSFVRTVYVYVIEARNGVIKIGRSECPAMRVKLFDLYSPVKTRLIAMWPDIMQAEAELHRRFHAQRLHAEWFLIEGPVADFVNEVRGCGLPEGVADWNLPTVESREEKRIRKNLAQSERMKAIWANPEWRENNRQLRESYKRRRSTPAPRKAAS